MGGSSWVIWTLSLLLAAAFTYFLPTTQGLRMRLWSLTNCLILCFWLWAISMTSMLSVWHPWEAGRPYWPVNLTEPWVFSGILLLQTNLCGKSKNAFGAGESQVLTLVLPCGLKSVARSPPGKKSHRVIHLLYWNPTNMYSYYWKEKQSVVPYDFL